MIDIILDEDDLESLELLKEVLNKENEAPDRFIGVFDIEPSSKDYPINSLYKNGRVVYINTKDGWKKFLEDGVDGENGKTYTMGGGGLGFNDVVKTIQNTTINSSNVFVGTGYTNSNSTNLLNLLHDFDDAINNGGGGGGFTGTIEFEKVTTSATYINTSATTLDGVIRDFDDIISKKILFGEYKTNDVFEENYLYVGYSSLSGDWYVKRVEETVSDIYIRYATVQNNPLVTTYSQAISGRDSLTYNLIHEII